jgi:oligoribonuclease
MTEAPTPAEPKLTKNDNNLVWIDCEMTGLDPEANRLLEIAVVVTSPDLSVRVEGPVYAIHQPATELAKMDKWNQNTHKASGLLARVNASTITEAEAEAGLLAFIRQHVGKSKSPLCGNTISQDRRFLVRYMPQLEGYLHYRNIDVSTLKELAARWKPEVKDAFKKAQKHTALADVHESIEELVHYRTHFLKL